MIGDNLPHHVTSAEDARAYAAAIAALRTEIEANEAAWAAEMAPLTNELKRMREQRDKENKPEAERMDGLRAELGGWLAQDPDGSIKDGDRIVATLSRKAGAPKIDAAKLPAAYMTMQPNMSAINAALARGEAVPGVTVPIATILRVLG